MRPGAVAVAVVVLGALPAFAQVDGDGHRNPASFAIGDAVRLDPHVKLQLDWRTFPVRPDGTTPDLFDLHRARAGVEGVLWNRVTVQVERELRHTDELWRDVYADLKVRREFHVRAGKFKMPFSLDALTSGTELDFAYRSLAATSLAPGREIGVMAHGSLGRRLEYQTAAFRQGGENAGPADARPPQRGGALAGRLTVTPWNGRHSTGPLRKLAAAVALTSSEVPEGLNSLRAETVSRAPLLAPMYVHGLRRRVETDVEWRLGPASVRGEFMRQVDRRRGEGTEDNDLPDLRGQGWYASGSWLLTGEGKKNDVRPARPLLRGGIGAVEVAARLEAIRLGNPAHGGPVSSSPRASYVADVSDRVWTIAINWYLNEFVRIQANAIHERPDSAETSMPDGSHTWSRVLRIQFAL